MHGFLGQVPAEARGVERAAGLPGERRDRPGHCAQRAILPTAPATIQRGRRRGYQVTPQQAWL